MTLATEWYLLFAPCEIFQAFLSSADFFEKKFREYNLSVKQIGSRSGPTFCRAWSGSKLFSKVISRRHKEIKSQKLVKDVEVMHLKQIFNLTLARYFNLGHTDLGHVRHILHCFIWWICLILFFTSTQQSFSYAGRVFLGWTSTKLG